MPASSLLTLLDDIASVLDDVATMTKVATKKTAGVLGDDLALNAQQVQGVRTERELPVVWAVARGSLLNKAILVPAALAISAVAPWAVAVLLMIGGAFLCYEGVEKLVHRWLHRDRKAEHAAEHAAELRALADPGIDIVALERDKIRGAVRTDFILSAEIIVIAMGAVAGQAFVTRVGVLVAIALIMVVGVYGLVAAIVKIDDLGLLLSRRQGDSQWARLQRALGAGLLVAAPWLMKALSVAGTAAMFLVGGGILVHGIPALHHAVEAFAHALGAFALVGELLANALVGVIAGAIVVAVIAGAGRLWRTRKAIA